MKKRAIITLCCLFVSLLVAAPSTLIFANKVNDYDVIFVSENETFYAYKEKRGNAVVFPLEAPTKQADNNYTYVFEGWSLNDENATAEDVVTEYLVSGNVTFYAVFSAKPLAPELVTVTFKDGLTNEVIEEVQVEVGGTVVAPEYNYHLGFDFTGWDKPLNNIYGRTEIVATYEEHEYNLRKNYLGKILNEDVKFNSLIDLSNPQVNQALNFEGWFLDQNFEHQINLNSCLNEQTFNIQKETQIIDIYAKFTLNLTSLNLLPNANLSYGNCENPVSVVGEFEEIEYNYTLKENNQPLSSILDAGTHTVTVEVEASLKEYQTLKAQTILTTTIDVQKANLLFNLTASSVVYGNSVNYNLAISGFKYDEQTTLQDSIDVDYVLNTNPLEISKFGGTIENLQVDSYTLTATLNLDDEIFKNYNLNSNTISAQFEVNKKLLTINVQIENSQSGKLVYGTTPIAKITYSGFEYSDNAQSVFKILPNVSYNQKLNVGSYQTNLTCANLTNYNVKINQADFEIVKKDLTIDVKLLTNKNSFVYGQQIEFKKEFSAFAYAEDENAFKNLNLIYKNHNDAYNLSTKYFDVGEFEAGVNIPESEIANNYNIKINPAKFSVTQQNFDIKIETSLNKNRTVDWSFTPKFNDGTEFNFEGTLKINTVQEKTISAQNASSLPEDLAWNNGYKINLNSVEVTNNFKLTYNILINLLSYKYEYQLEKDPCAFDGNEHEFGLKDVQINDPEFDGEIKVEYSYKILPAGETIDLHENKPRFINAGEYQISYKISNGYDEETGNFNVQISKIDYQISTPTICEFTYTGENLFNQVQISVKVVDGQKFTINYGSSELDVSSSSLTIQNANSYNVFYKVFGNGNYNDANGNYSVKINKANYTLSQVSKPNFGNVQIKYSKDKILCADEYNTLDLTKYNSTWVAGQQVVLGTKNYNAIFNADPQNYNDFPYEISLTVVKQEIKVVGAEFCEVDFGTELGALNPKFNFSAEESLSADALEYLNSYIQSSYSVADQDYKTFGGTYVINYTVTLQTNDYFILPGEKPDVEVKSFIKVKSVELNGAKYTIEDALYLANTSTEKVCLIVNNNIKFLSDATKQELSVYNYEIYNDLLYTTINNNVTLLLPAKANTSIVYSITRSNLAVESLYKESQYKQIELILPDNFTLINKGDLLIGGETTGGNGGNYVNGQTCGNYAQITLCNNAKIENYGKIDCFGFIKEKDKDNSSQLNMLSGQLTIPFIVSEHRGGTIFSSLLSLQGSPFNRFYMQNVTSNLMVERNAKLIGRANLYAKSQNNVTDIVLSGSADNALLQLSDGAKIEAKYDITSKVIDLKIIGNVKLNALSMSLAGTNLSMKNLLFPVSWYYNISLIALGSSASVVDITNIDGIKLLPSAKLYIGKNVTLKAKSIAVYDKFDDVSVASSIYEKKDIPAQLIIDGCLEVDSIGGLVTASADGALLKVLKNNNVDSYEVGGSSSSPEFVKTNYKLTFANNENPEINSYEAKSSNWVVYEDESLTYSITYQFKFKQQDSLQDNLAEVANPNSESYNVYEALTLLDAQAEGWTFEGWYLDETCQQKIDIISGQLRKNIDIYGLFTQEKYYVVNVVTGNSAVKLNNLTILGRDIVNFDPTIEFGDKISNYDADLTFAKYFDGWFLDEQFETPYSAENLKAKYGEASNQTINIYIKWADKIKLNISISSSTLNINGTNFSKNSTLYLKENSPVTAVAAATVLADFKSFTISPTPSDLVEDTTNNTKYFTITKTVYTLTVVSESSFPCLAEGTKVLLANGTQKNVEDLTTNDELLVFDHFTGEWKSSNLLFLVHKNYGDEQLFVITLKFSNGSVLKIVGDHGLFDLTLNKYVDINKNNIQQFMHHNFASVDYNTLTTVPVQLVDYSIEYQTIKFYSPVSVGSMNVVAENLLTTTPFPYALNEFMNLFDYNENMQYNQVEMQQDIDRFGIYTYNDFKDYMDYDLFVSMPWAYYKVLVGKGLVTFDDVLKVIDYIYESGQVY